MKLFLIFAKTGCLLREGKETLKWLTAPRGHFWGVICLGQSNRQQNAAHFEASPPKAATAKS